MGKLRVLKPVVISLLIIASSLAFTVNSISIQKDYDKHIIDNVPYVGQYENFYCNWACFAMILQYYGINASLNEVLFNHGMGYSQQYFDSEVYRLPRSGHHMSLDPYNYLYLTDIYGLSFTPFYHNYSSDERWDVNWPRIKENLTNDVPVIVFVNALVLLSEYIQQQGKLPLKNLITDPSYFGIHYVLLVGYDESNNSVCYNDPSYQIIDKPDVGTYRWTDMETFELAHETLSERYPSDHLFQVFEKVGEPMSKDEAFLHAYERNIEKLKGNRSAYYPFNSSASNWSSHSKYGIDASELLQKHFEIPERDITIKAYKMHGLLTGFVYDFLNRIYNIYLRFQPYEKNIFDMIMKRLISFFDHVSYDKKYNAEYLKEASESLQNETLRNLCSYEADLFERESENWTKLSSCYSEFLNKGVFISNFKANNLMDHMDNAIDNIIKIEQEIITYSIYE